MLISVPGNRIQEMLSYGDERVEEVNAPQYTNVSSLLHSPSAAGSQPRQPLPLVSIISLYIAMSLYSIFLFCQDDFLIRTPCG
jgi:hypothetical protein